MYFKPHRAWPAIVGSNGPWIEVIFWNRPRAELVGFAARGFQPDSLAISLLSAAHCRPEPQPNVAATALTAARTAGEPPPPPEMSPRSSIFDRAYSSTAPMDLSMKPLAVWAMLLPGKRLVISAVRFLVPRRASSMMAPI